MTQALISHLPYKGGWEGYDMKRYNKPNIEIQEAECVQIIAVSLIDGVNADDSEVMTKENNDWQIWKED